MPQQNIIAKLKKFGLCGRSGSGFPTGLKWECVKKAKSDKKYIICNGSEGELGVLKDGFILQNHPEKIVQGIKIALKNIDHSSAYIYLRQEYYQKFKNKLQKLIGSAPIIIFKKTGGYISGEETTVIATIEGRRQVPTAKPPYPTQAGLWGYPTLINNVETFYAITQIVENKYDYTRFYTLAGDIKHPGVYQLPENWTVRQILTETKNLPSEKFFVQSGGGAIGQILLPNELNQPVGGTGAIIVYDRAKTDVFKLMKKWVQFFLYGNCDKCVPCREGLYRLDEMIDRKKIDQTLLNDLFLVLENTSLCALGSCAVTPFKTLINKVILKK